MNNRRRVAIISTGGTIEKTYCPRDGALRNSGSVLDMLLSSLEMRDLEIERIPLLDKDSLEMDDADHDLIARTVGEVIARTDGVIVVHGTDRLAITGEIVLKYLESRDLVIVPVVLTGAMRPFELRTSDATQNITEALLAVRLLDPGVYCAMHGQVLRFPGVTKDHERGTFIPTPE